MNTFKLKTKLKSFNLQDMLVTLVIIGILILLALPVLMPLIAKAKATEAQIQLKQIHTNQTTFRYMYSKYAMDFAEIDFEAPKTVKENGQSNYNYEIISADNSMFLARATAIVDFDGDGVFNVWEINQNGAPKQIVKD